MKRSIPQKYTFVFLFLFSLTNLCATSIAPTPVEAELIQEFNSAASHIIEQEETPLPEKLSLLDKLSQSIKNKLKIVTTVVTKKQDEVVTKENELLKKTDAEITASNTALIGFIKKLKGLRKISTAEEKELMAAVKQAEKIQAHAETASIALTIIAGIGGASTGILASLGFAIPLATVTLIGTITLILGIITKITIAISKIAELRLAFDNIDIDLIEDPELKGRIKNYKKSIDTVQKKMDVLKKKINILTKKLDLIKAKIDSITAAAKEKAASAKNSISENFDAFKNKISSLFDKKKATDVKQLEATAKKELATAVPPVKKIITTQQASQPIVIKSKITGKYYEEDPDL